MPCSNALLMLLCLATLHVPAVAQQPLFTTPLDSGQLVRLRLDDGRLVRGRLLRPLTSQSLHVTFCHYPAPPCRTWAAPGVDSLRIPVLVDVEVAQGTRLWRGVTIGAAIGGALGLLYALTYNVFCDSYGCGISVPVGVVTGAVFVGAWGALFGSQGTVWGPAP